MIILRIIFYALAVLILLSTAMAITRKNLVHAIIYLVISFFSTAALFYLLGAPLLAGLEVIIYAGAIMVLFLFIVMTVTGGQVQTSQNWRQWIFPTILGLFSLALTVILLFAAPALEIGLRPAMANPAVFGQILFEK